MTLTNKIEADTQIQALDNINYNKNLAFISITIATISLVVSIVSLYVKLRKPKTLRRKETRAKKIT